MKKLDKKQVPQFIALCVLTAGVSGYMVVHLVAPGPVSAGTRGPAATPAAGQAAALGVNPAAAPGSAASAGPAAGTDGAAVPETAEAGDAPPPTPTMHDPFAVGYVDPATLPAALPMLPAPALPKMPGAAKVASTGPLGPLPVAFPGASTGPGQLSSFPGSLPPAQSAAPLAPPAPALPPPAPAAPLWTVTGVLQGADGKVAILRSGESRRIVRSGDFVDSTYRVTGVTRTAVILRHGTTFYHLVLGAVKTAPAAPGAAKPETVPAVLPSLPLPVPAPRSAALIDDTSVPLKQQGAARLGTPAKRVSPAKVASAISLGLRLLDGSVLAQNSQSHKE